MWGRIYVQKLKAAGSLKLKIHLDLQCSPQCWGAIFLWPQAPWGQDRVSNTPLFHLLLHPHPQRSTEELSFNQILHRGLERSHFNVPVLESCTDGAPRAPTVLRVHRRCSACTAWARPSARCSRFGSSICAVSSATTLNPQFKLGSCSSVRGGRRLQLARARNESPQTNKRTNNQRRSPQSADAPTPTGSSAKCSWMAWSSR